jgi:4-carboxymuconolactone decarboxylase
MAGPGPSTAGSPGENKQVPRVAAEQIHAAAPALGWYTDSLLFHQVWNRVGLAKRDRSLITVSALITCGNIAQLKSHFNRALSNGVRPAEIVEIITHLAFFAGWPHAMSSVPVMEQVFSDQGINSKELAQTANAAQPAYDTPADRNAVPRPGGEGLFTSILHACTGPVVSGELWRRAELSHRDRSLVTISSLIASGQFQDLQAYAQKGLQDGLNMTELSEAVAHLAFYVGLPKAAAAAKLLDGTITQGE